MRDSLLKGRSPQLIAMFIRSNRRHHVLCDHFHLAERVVTQMGAYRPRLSDRYTFQHIVSCTLKFWSLDFSPSVNNYKQQGKLAFADVSFTFFCLETRTNTKLSSTSVLRHPLFPNYLLIVSQRIHSSVINLGTLERVPSVNRVLSASRVRETHANAAALHGNSRPNSDTPRSRSQLLRSEPGVAQGQGLSAVSVATSLCDSVASHEMNRGHAIQTVDSLANGPVGELALGGRGYDLNMESCLSLWPDDTSCKFNKLRLPWWHISPTTAGLMTHMTHKNSWLVSGLKA